VLKSAMLEQINPEWRELPWEQALAAARPPVAQALETVLAGKDLGLEDGLLLSTVEGDDVIALVRVADELRRRVNGDAITYVVNRNLNFTNVCIVGCSFCGFGRHADDPDASTAITTSIFSALSNRACPISTSTPIPPWRSATASKRRACRCANIC
jgi:hypothetical protein